MLFYANNDKVWKRKAEEEFPAATLSLEGYGTYKGLLRDKNRLHASIVLPLTGTRCLWKFNSLPRAYYECRLLALQWKRDNNIFRLFFDARGEQDLRHPSQSSLGFMVYRDPAELLTSWQRWHSQLLARLARAPSPGEREAIRQEIAQHQAQYEGLAAAAAGAAQGTTSSLTEPVFQDLLTVVRPSSVSLVTDSPGHFMGHCEFDNLDQISTILEELPDTYASKLEAQRHGLQLVFCYANPIPVMPHSAMVDYYSTPLLTLLPGQTLEGVLMERGHYAQNGEPLVEVLRQGPEQAQRAAWAHVGEQLLDRHDPPWFV
ncbi:hypothetical protein N2152v2_000356 [Parachlorella kessleri]